MPNINEIPPSDTAWQRLVPNSVSSSYATIKNVFQCILAKAEVFARKANLISSSDAALKCCRKLEVNESEKTLQELKIDEASKRADLCYAKIFKKNEVVAEKQTALEESKKIICDERVKACKEMCTKLEREIASLNQDDPADQVTKIILKNELREIKNEIEFLEGKTKVGGMSKNSQLGELKMLLEAKKKELQGKQQELKTDSCDRLLLDLRINRAEIKLIEKQIEFVCASNSPEKQKLIKAEIALEKAKVDFIKTEKEQGDKLYFQSSADAVRYYCILHSDSDLAKSSSALPALGNYIKMKEVMESIRLPSKPPFMSDDEYKKIEVFFNEKLNIPSDYELKLGQVYNRGGFEQERKFTENTFLPPKPENMSEESYEFIKDHILMKNTIAFELEKTKRQFEEGYPPTDKSKSLSELTLSELQDKLADLNKQYKDEVSNVVAKSQLVRDNAHKKFADTIKTLKSTQNEVTRLKHPNLEENKQRGRALQATRSFLTDEADMNSKNNVRGLGLLSRVFPSITSHDPRTLAFFSTMNDYIADLDREIATLSK